MHACAIKPSKDGSGDWEHRTFDRVVLLTESIWGGQGNFGQLKIDLLIEGSSWDRVPLIEFDCI